MVTGPTPERRALDRMMGAFKRLQEKRQGAGEPAPAEGASPPPAAAERGPAEASQAQR